MNCKRRLTISEAEIDAIAAGDLASLPEGGNHLPGAALFSVKRVPRDLASPIRRHIESLYD